MPAVVNVHERLKKLYLEGKSRQEAMAAVGLTENDRNRMAGLSNRLNLHWSWPLENRKSGKEPPAVLRPKRSRVARKGAPQNTEKKPRRQRPAGGPFEDKPIPRELVGRYVDDVKPARLKGRAPELHRSAAFPSAGEDGLSESDLRFLAANLYGL